MRVTLFTSGLSVPLCLCGEISVKESQQLQYERFFGDHYNRTLFACLGWNILRKYLGMKVENCELAIFPTALRRAMTRSGDPCRPRPF